MKLKHEELIASLRQLFLHEMAIQYVEVSKIAEKEKKTYEQYLTQLVTLELQAKHRQRVNRLTREAKLPLRKSLESYNFDCRKGITAQQFNRLASGEFVKQAANVVFFGSFGVGKSHLAIALIERL